MRTIHCPAARASLSLDVGAWLKRLASGPSACTRHNHMAAAGPHPDPQRPEAEQPLLHSAHTTCTCVQTTTLALRSRASRNCTPHGHRSCTSFTTSAPNNRRTATAKLCALSGHMHMQMLSVHKPSTASCPCPSERPCPASLALVSPSSRKPSGRPRATFAPAPTRAMDQRSTAPTAELPKCTFAPSSSRHALASRAGQRRVKRAVGLCP